jgi:hypothetical protein
MINNKSIEFDYVSKYKLQNPAKYIANIEHIKSQYIDYNTEKELQYIENFDTGYLTLAWGFKEIVIDYINPITKEKGVYVPHFYACYCDESTENITEVLIDLDEPDIFEIPCFDEEDYKKLSKKDKIRLQNLEILQAGQIEKYEKANKYCKSRCMNFFISTADGFLQLVSKAKESIN